MFKAWEKPTPNSRGQHPNGGGQPQGGQPTRSKSDEPQREKRQAHNANRKADQKHGNNAKQNHSPQGNETDEENEQTEQNGQATKQATKDKAQP